MPGGAWPVELIFYLHWRPGGLYLTIYLLKCWRSKRSLASGKGIAITAAIMAAIIGASFLVWFIPMSSPGSLDVPRTDSEAISEVYSRHLDLAATVEQDFSGWKNGTLGMQEMLARLDSAAAETEQIRRTFDRQPAQEWQESYNLYEAALDAFADYLQATRSAVEEGNAAGPHQDIDDLKAEWQNFVEESV